MPRRKSPGSYQSTASAMPKVACFQSPLQGLRLDPLWKLVRARNWRPSSLLLPSQTINLLEHLVGGLHDPRIGFVRALRDDHLDKLLHDADIRSLEIALLKITQAIGSSGCAEYGIPGSGSRQKEVLADAVQPARIGEQSKLDVPYLLRCLLAHEGCGDGSVGADRDRGRPLRNGDRRLHGVPVRGHDVALRVEMKSSAAGVGGVAAGQLHLEKSLAFNSQIERIAGRAHVALQLNDLRRGRTSAETDLQACRNRRLLGRRRSRHDHILVEQILKLEPPSPETGRAGVGQVVGDGIEIELLRLHAA